MMTSTRVVKSALDLASHPTHHLSQHQEDEEWQAGQSPLVNCFDLEDRAGSLPNSHIDPPPLARHQQRSHGQCKRRNLLLHNPGKYHNHNLWSTSHNPLLLLLWLACQVIHGTRRQAQRQVVCLLRLHPQLPPKQKTRIGLSTSSMGRQKQNLACKRTRS